MCALLLYFYDHFYLHSLEIAVTLILTKELSSDTLACGINVSRRLENLSVLPSEPSSTNSEPRG
jgi:hypothetical protein